MTLEWEEERRERRAAAALSDYVKQQANLITNALYQHAEHLERDGFEPAAQQYRAGQADPAVAHDQAGSLINNNGYYQSALRFADAIWRARKAARILTRLAEVGEEADDGTPLTLDEIEREEETRAKEDLGRMWAKLPDPKPDGPPVAKMTSPRDVPSPEELEQRQQERCVHPWHSVPPSERDGKPCPGCEAPAPPVD